MDLICIIGWSWNIHKLNNSLSIHMNSAYSKSLTCNIKYKIIETSISDRFHQMQDVITLGWVPQDRHWQSLGSHTNALMSRAMMLFSIWNWLNLLVTVLQYQFLFTYIFYRSLAYMSLILVLIYPIKHAIVLVIQRTHININYELVLHVYIVLYIIYSSVLPLFGDTNTFTV